MKSSLAFLCSLWLLSIFPGVVALKFAMAHPLMQLTLKLNKLQFMKHKLEMVKGSRRGAARDPVIGPQIASEFDSKDPDMEQLRRAIWYGLPSRPQPGEVYAFRFRYPLDQDTVDLVQASNDQGILHLMRDKLHCRHVALGMVLIKPYGQIEARLYGMQWLRPYTVFPNGRKEPVRLGEEIFKFRSPSRDYQYRMASSVLPYEAGIQFISKPLSVPSLEFIERLGGSTTDFYQHGLILLL